MRYLVVFVLVIFGENLAAQHHGPMGFSKQKNLTNKEKVISISGLPISFYLNHPKIDSSSKKFYRGELSVSADSILEGIIDSVLTNNLTTRPFYFFVFNQIVNLSEGSMIDLVGHKELQFIEKYPCDFFMAFNQTDIDVNVVKWTTFMGKTLENKANYYEYRNKIDSKLKGNCSDLQDVFKSFFTEVRMCLVK